MERIHQLTSHPIFMFRGRMRKKKKTRKGTLLNKSSRSSSHTQPWHHPLKSLAQSVGKEQCHRGRGMGRGTEMQTNNYKGINSSCIAKLNIVYWNFVQTKRLSSDYNSHPSPVRAQQAWMCHWWSLTEVSWRLWEISVTDMQPFTSCLLAKINNPAFLKSWSADRRNQKKTG